MIGNVFAGLWIDKDGAKRVLVIGMIATGIVLFTYLLVNSPWTLVLVRFIHGICGGFLVPAAFTMLANRSKDEQKGRSMAFSGAAVGVAAISGPAFGGIITSKFGIEWVFISIGCLMIITAVVVHFILPEAKKPMTRRLDGASTQSLFFLLKNYRLINSYLGAFSLMFGQGVLAFLLPLKVASLNYDTQLAGILMSVFGIAAIIVFASPINNLFDNVSHQITMIIGVGVIVISLLSLSIVNEKLIMFAILAIFGVGFALVFPSVNAIIIEQTERQDRGKAFGLFYAFFSLGVVGGSVITGIISMPIDTSFMITSYLLIINIILMIIIVQLARKKEKAY